MGEKDKEKEDKEEKERKKKEKKEKPLSVGGYACFVNFKTDWVNL